MFNSESNFGENYSDAFSFLRGVLYPCSSQILKGAG